MSDTKPDDPFPSSAASQPAAGEGPAEAADETADEPQTPAGAEGPEAHTSPPWGLTTKAIVASAAIIGITLVIWRFQTLLSTLVLAAIIAYLLNPAIRWLRVKTGINRGTAVLIVYTFLLFVAGGAGTFIGVTVAEQSARLWNNLPELLPRIVDQFQQRTFDVVGLSLQLGPYTLDMQALENLVDWDVVVQELREGVQTYLGRGGLALAGLFQATLSTVAELLLVVVISIYLAIDAPRIGSGISGIAQQPGYRDDAERLMADTVLIWNAYLRGQVSLGIIMGVVVWAVLSVAGVNYALELGLVSGLLEFLPIIGPVIGTGAAVLVALLQNSNPWNLSPWVFALIVLAIMTTIQQIENAFLVPWIVGESLDLHPIVIMVGVLMGASLAGLLGAVLAAPVLASLKLYGTYVWRKMLDLPPFPASEPADWAESPSTSSPSLGARFAMWFQTQRSREK